jgi:hypothetical protein
VTKITTPVQLGSVHSSGSLAMLAAIRRASSRVSGLPADRGSSLGEQSVLKNVKQGAIHNEAKRQVAFRWLSEQARLRRRFTSH